MNKRILAVLAVLIAFTMQITQAQDVIKIKGKVIDKQTSEPIIYAAIGLVGTFVGTVSNNDGEFELKIPTGLSYDTVLISAVGYVTKTLSIKENAGKSDVLVDLVSREFQIQEIDVTAKSLYFQKIIKEAVNHLETNYIQMPFNYDVYYRSEEKRNDTVTRLREAAVKIYDSEGYKRGGVHKVFTERNYKFLQVKRNFVLSSLDDGSTNLDDVLEMDITRVSGNVLDVKYLHIYNVTLEKVIEYEGDSVWVLNYESEKPTLGSTGDYYATSYTGKIYIKKSDYAVIKNETVIQSANYSNLGRSFYVNEKKQTWKPLLVTYDFTVIYKKHFNSYYLSYVEYNRKLELQNKKTSAKKTEQLKTKMMVNKIVTIKPIVIEKRAYYENIPFDKTFWDNYNYLVDEKK